MKTKRAACISLLVYCLALTACQCGRKGSERRFELSGTVVSVDRQQRQAAIAHREIPGYMAAMTMSFSIRDDWSLRILAPGQTVKATLIVDGERSWLEGITITEASSQGPASGPPANYSEPTPGAEIPDFQFVNQDGREVHLHQYRGRTLVITFIYTRCPLPDYCPRVSRNFSEIHAALVRNPLLRAGTHLLTISFDPQFDTPAVLKQYGAAYALRASQEPFQYWEFATGTPAEVKEAALYFGLYYQQDSGQIVHSLRTAVIAPDGKLARVYRGNDWTPGEIIEELVRLAPSK